jgi:secreted trypsin-like serine protease
MKLRLSITLLLALALVAIGLVPTSAQAKPKGPSGPVTPQIVGGTVATPGAWPWQVRISRSGNTGIYCGGSLIHPQWVLTAAHCAQASLSGYTVVLGDHNRTTSEGTEQFRTVAQIIVHPSYNASTYNNDLALFKLSSAVTLNSRVQLVTLERSNTGLTAGVSTIVTGWGTTSSGGSTSTTLRQVTVPIVSNTTCNSSSSYAGDVTSNMLCAGSAGKDSCQGDSGGPLLVASTNRQAGIVSWGQGCALANYPGVYTRVPNYISWIQQYVTIQ